MYSIEISREVIKLRENHPNNNSFQDLSILDYYLNPLYSRFIYLFENENKKKVDVELLKKSLEETLEDYPELTGSVEVAERIKLHFNNNGALFIICKTTNSYNEVLNMKAEDKEALYDVPRDNYTYGYLCKIKLTLLKDNAISFCFVLSHAILDGHGLFRFINAWSHKHKEMMGIGSFFNSYLNSDIKERALIKGYDIPPVDRCSTFVIKPSSNPTHNFSHKFTQDFVILKEKLAYWKKKFVQEYRKADDPQFISSKNVFCAIYWKALVSINYDEATEMSKMRMMINVRKRLNISENFTGNCSLPINMEFSKDTINNLDVCELACLIRKELDTLTKEKVLQMLTFMESPSNWSHLRPNYFGGKIDFAFTDLESFPVLAPDFSYGRAEKLIFPNGWHGALVLSEMKGTGVFHLNINRSKDLIKCIENDINFKKIILETF